jgi:hypothetical protein
MSDTRDQLLRVYAAASGGNPEAYAWLLAFHGWIHRIDDFVDEPNHYAAEVVDLCADGVVILSSPFYRRHAEALGPLLCVVAEEYRASLTATGVLAHVLRVAGNHVVLGVAYLTGGRALVRQVSEALWPIVHNTQLIDVSNPS